MWLSWLLCSALLFGDLILQMLIHHLGFIPISCAREKGKDPSFPLFAPHMIWVGKRHFQGESTTDPSLGLQSNKKSVTLLPEGTSPCAVF